MTPIEFKAPWSRSLKLATAFTLSVLVVVFLLALRTLESEGPMLAKIVFLSLPPGIAVLALPFMVRGYVLTDQEIIVRRLGFQTRLPLQGLQSVGGDAEAMKYSFRVFGNGGLFGFTGEFWSRRLGRYRALATDPSRAVVLKYQKRTIVITPHDPQQFIMRARTVLKFAQSGYGSATMRRADSH